MLGMFFWNTVYSWTNIEDFNAATCKPWYNVAYKTELVKRIQPSALYLNRIPDNIDYRLELSDIDNYLYKYSRHN